jgi:hypothetical protein
MKILSLVCGLSTLIISFVRFHWWTPILVVVVGIFLGFVASAVLKSMVQLLAIVGLLLGFVLCPLWVL